MDNSRIKHVGAKPGDFGLWQQCMPKKVQEIFAVLNTHLDQFADSVSNIQVEDFFWEKKLKIYVAETNQDVINLLAGSQSCDRVEDLHNLKESGYLNGQTSKNQVVHST